MRRTIVLAAFLALFLIPSLNPSPSSILAHRVNAPFEAQESSFLTAADGDESSSSLTSFSETLSEDVLFYPDAFDNGTSHNPSAGSATASGGSTGGSHTDLAEQDGVLYWANDDGGPPFMAAIYVNVTRDIIGLEVVDINIYAKYNVSGGSPAVTPSINMKNSTGYNKVRQSLTTSFAWYNWTAEDYEYWSYYESDGVIYFSISGGHTQTIGIWIDCVELKYHTMTLADSEHYADGFCDVSDWNAFYHSEISTDGDVANITCNLATYGVVKSTNTEGWVNYTVSAGDYAEIRLLSTSTAQYYFKLYYDDGGVTGDWIVWEWSSTYGTRKAIISNDVPVGAVIYEVRFYIKNVNQYILPDYLRVGPADEMGGAHDGSTIEGVTDDAAADNTYTTSSDDDILTLNVTRSAGAGGNAYGNFYIAFDTTATPTDLENTYYPFFEIRVRLTTSLYVNTHAIRPTYDSKYVNIVPTKDIWETHCVNMAAGSALALAQVRFYAYLAPGYSAQWEMEWCKAFGIANYTLSQSASATTTDYAYVDSSGRLVVEKSSSEWLKFEHDPALSVAVGTYPVWNCTLTGPPTSADYISYYVGGVEESYYWSDTRGGFTGTGTLTDLRFVIRYDETLSAIKFIEDGTAPAVVRSSSTPNDPSDDEGVMLTAVVTDAVEVYKVYFDAIVSPAGFSDVPYYATEQTDNLWTYEFATLPTGPYVFKIVATDGANENALTEYAYIELTVREAAITIEEITLAGAGSDFSMMTFSARINKDCSYVIYEESANNPEAATHSGSVSEPSFNLAWTKLSTTDTNVNFTIKFTNSTLTYNYTSQYQVAQTALAIDGDESLSQDEIIYSGTSTKACSWTLYLDSVQEDTGTISAAGSFVVNWTRTESVTPASISYAIKFYTATETIWENGTYDEYSLTAFSIQTLFMDLTDPSISAIFTTSWGNATGYLYENDVQKDTGAEGVPLTYTKATVAGTYNVALKMDAGGEVAWYNTTYSVGAEDALSITALSYDSSGPNVTLFVNTNWANCTLTLYENDVQKATGSEGTLSYLKATTAGDYNVSMKVDGTAAIEWANYTYTVAAESALIINTLILDKTGPNITAFITTNWLNCTITIYQDDVQKDSDSEGITLSYARSTAAGTYDIAIKIDGGASTLWHNDSYTIAIEYSWQYIYVFDTGDPATYFPWESFDFYVNGSLIEKNEFHGRTDQGYRIAVVDKFGDTIYNATHSFDYTYRLSIAIYSFKIKCWVDGEVNVTITSSGGGVMNTWMGWGDLEPFYLYGSKTYQVKWHLDDSDRKVKATGWHYYPAIDWDGNQANPDPNWYGPVSASYLTIDDYGIGHLVGVVENIDDGGGGGDANNTALAQAAIAAIAPIAIGSVIATAGIVGAIVWYFLPSRIPGVREPPKPQTSNKPPRHKPAPSVGMASRKMQSRTSIKKKESRTK